MTPREYTVIISAELADQHREWTRIEDTGVRWFKVVPHDDGTADVWLNTGEDEPKDPS